MEHKAPGYTTPAMFDSKESPLPEEEEKAEMLAKAFSITSKEYFKKKVDLENQIAVNEEKKTFGRNVFIVAIIIGMLLIVGGIYLGVINNLNGFLALLIAGIVAIVSGFIYGHYMNYTTAIKTIEQLMAQLKSLAPEKKVSFVSKAYFPIYLVPYTNGAIVFDSASRGDKETIELHNLSADEVGKNFRELRDRKENFDKFISEKNLMNVDFIQMYDPEVLKEKVIERNISNALSELIVSTNKISKQTLSFNVQKPDTHMVIGISNLWNKHAIEVKGQLLSTEPKFKFQEAVDISKSLRGVELESARGDIISQVEAWKSEIENLISPIENVLQNNLEILNKHYELINSTAYNTIHKQICPKCLDEEKNREDRRIYNMAELIGNRFKMAIDEMTPLAQTEVREKIKKEINVSLPDSFMDVMMVSYQLNEDNGRWKCKEHGIVESSEIISPEIIQKDYYAEVFAHTGDSLYTELEKPVKERLVTARKDADEKIDFKDSQELRMIGYKQTGIQLKVESANVKSELEEARRIINIGGR